MQEIFSKKMYRLGKQALGVLSFSLIATGLYGETQFFRENYIIPAFDGLPNSEFAQFDSLQEAYTEWENPFYTPVPEDVNTPTAESHSTNGDAVLAQIGTDTAWYIQSSGGIYSFSEPTSFLVYDDPAYSPGQVVFQVNTVGSLPDKEAVIYLRETEGGPVIGPIAYTHIGFLTSNDGQGIMAWEWDLSAYDVVEYYIEFGSTSESMSLWWATLDTWDGFSAELSNAIFPKTNTNFATGAVGSVEHELSGGGGPRITYEPGDEVVLTAVAEPGWVFVRWTGDVDSTNPSVVTTIDGNLDVKAVFAPQTYDKWKDNIILPSFTGSDPEVNGKPDADPNQNGLINLLEYAFGGTPEEMSDPAAFPQAGISEDGKHLTLTYRRQPVATDLEYRVVVSNDMETWNSNGDGSGQTYTTEDISPTINEDGTQTVIVTDMTDLNTLPEGTVRQMRLQITLDN